MISRHFFLATATLLSAATLSGCMGTTEAPQFTVPTDPDRPASAAEANCLQAVANKAGTGDVSMLSVSPSEAGTVVMVDVPGAASPWRCISSNDGVVQEVVTTG